MKQTPAQERRQALKRCYELIVEITKAKKDLRDFLKEQNKWEVMLRENITRREDEKNKLIDKFNIKNDNSTPDGDRKTQDIKNDVRRKRKSD